MWAFIGVLVGALSGEKAGSSIGESAGIFFALVGLVGGGYLGHQIDKSFELQSKQKNEEKMRLRKEEEKYSHLATLQEVLENDYNLNIPRYVNTFEEEEQIEINQIAKELRELDKSTEEIDKKLADFCKELNIEIPF